MPHWRTPAVLALAAAIGVGCAAPRSIAAQGASRPAATIERTRQLLSAIADDSMEGRRVATRGEARAARYIADVMREVGLKPAGDSGFLQRLPMATVTTRTTGANGQERVRTGLTVLPSFSDLDTIPAERRLVSVNVLGVLPGGDPSVASEIVVVGAHFDHLGIRTVGEGDSVYNGADDDASGVVAMLESARILATGPRPRRTVLFAAFTGEETGTFAGVRWYLRNPIVPLERHVADLQIEMIGRPDSLAGGPGKAWLTGFERSTVGDLLVAGGLPVVADPRPAQRFYIRSDNIVFARLGIVAHTVSSYGMHGDYHTVRDEASLVDFAHMTEVVNITAQAVELLADGPRPEWKPGGRP